MIARETTADVSVEFAHVYADASYSPEHARAATLACSEASEFAAGGLALSLVVLVDDYNPSRWSLDLDDFVARLAGAGAEPDFIVRESSLCSSAPDLLAGLSGRLRREHERYHGRHKKWTCSFLVAVWNLIRAGVLAAPTNMVVGGCCADITADSLVTILPERYRPVEERALDLIAASPYADVTERMRYVWF